MKKIALFFVVFFKAQWAWAMPYFNTSNGHYYEVFRGGYTWEEANAEANARTYKGLQGHLATITSAEENQWIFDNLQNDDGVFLADGTFIGATDKDVDGTWEWVTGEAFSYSDWLPGEPNNWNGLEEDYIMIWWNQEGQTSSPGWNDTTNNPILDVNFEMGYLIEYDAGTASNVPLPAAAWFFISGLALLGVRKNRAL